MREKEAGLLHHQLDKSLGARIALTFAHLSVSLSTDFASLFTPAPLLHLPTCLTWGISELITLFKSGVFRAWPHERTIICLHISAPSGTFLKILLEVTPCWKLKLHQGQQNGWIVPKRSISFEQNSFIYANLAVGGKTNQTLHGLSWLKRQGLGLSFRERHPSWEKVFKIQLEWWKKERWWRGDFFLFPP